MLSRKQRQAAAFLLPLLSIAIVHFLPEYWAYLANLVGIGVIFALSLNALMGFSGQISLGHAAFLGIGGYASALLTMRTGLPFWVALPAAGVVSGFFGLAMGLPALRIGSHYLAMVTIAFGTITFSLSMNLRAVTNGYAGLVNIPAPSLFGIALDTQKLFYPVVLLVLILVFVAMERLRKSWIGRALLSMREDEVAAESLGVPVMKYKLGAFVLSAFVAGLSGSVYAHWIQFMSPESMHMNASLAPFVAVLVGGAGSVAGVAVAAIVLSLLPEFLRFTPEYYMLLYGLSLLIFGIFLPDGVAGVYRQLAVRRATALVRQTTGRGQGAL